MKNQTIKTAKQNLANALPHLKLTLIDHNQLANDLDLLCKTAEESELLKQKLEDSEKRVADLNKEIEELKK